MRTATTELEAPRFRPDRQPSAIVADDDSTTRQLIHTILTEAGLHVTETDNGVDAVDLVQRLDPELVTVDVGLPGIDGFETVRRIRAISSCYIAMVTGHTGEADTLAGLAAGADEYIEKPFRPRILRARIEALQNRPRRHRESSHANRSLPDPVCLSTGGLAVQDDRSVRRGGELSLRHNGLTLDPISHITTLDGREILLTPREFEILRTLLTAGRAILSKTRIANILQQKSWPGVLVSTRAIEVHVANIRRKIGSDSRHPRIIETVHGFGYRCTVPR